jgi:Domain of unknown function (DUF4864)
MQREARMKRVARSVFAAGALAGIVLAASALTAFAGPPPGHAKLRPAEWTAIKVVIGDQLTALKAGDGTKAMAFSVPGIRQQFRTPERFLRMVREGYSALLDARYSTFLDGAVVDGITIQPLQLVLPDNSVVVALYRMEKQKDGIWRIAGCVIAPSTAQST